MSDTVEHLYRERHDDPDEEPVCIGQWCCGCEVHPIGKPWGWNSDAWLRHFNAAHAVGEEDE